MKNFTIRKAKVIEAKSIQKLIDYYADRALMIKRPLDNIYSAIREFYVCLPDETNEIIGVCALTIFTEKYAEIRSLAVSQKYLSAGIGKELVLSCIDEAKEYAIKNVFTLTYVGDFFEKIGFKPIEKEKLPHKIWRDCINCMHFPDCDEKAYIFNI